MFSILPRHADYFRVVATLTDNTTKTGPTFNAATGNGVDERRSARKLYIDQPGVDAPAFKPQAYQSGLTWSDLNKPGYWNVYKRVPPPPVRTAFCPSRTSPRPPPPPARAVSSRAASQKHRSVWYTVQGCYGTNGTSGRGPHTPEYKVTVPENRLSLATLAGDLPTILSLSSVAIDNAFADCL